MKMSDLKQRLRKDRPMTAVTLRMPEDVIEDLKRIAPLLGYSGYQPLIRAYIGQGLRADLARIEEAPMTRLLENLKAQGVPEETLTKALTDLSDDHGTAV
jgi:hypothetical protein